MLCALRVYGLTHPHLEYGPSIRLIIGMNLITLSFFHSSPLFFTRPCLVLLWKTSWRSKPSDSLHLSYRGFYLPLPNPCFNTKAPQRKVSSGKKIKAQPDHIRNFMNPQQKTVILERELPDALLLWSPTHPTYVMQAELRDFQMRDNSKRLCHAGRSKVNAIFYYYILLIVSVSRFSVSFYL